MYFVYITYKKSFNINPRTKINQQNGRKNTINLSMYLVLYIFYCNVEEQFKQYDRTST